MEPKTFFYQLANYIIDLKKHSVVEINKFILKKPFFASSWKAKIIKDILKNNSFSRTEKERRITGVLISLAFEHITRLITDIGNWSDIQCNVTCRDVNSEYSYYKNLFS